MLTTASFTALVFRLLYSLGHGATATAIAQAVGTAPSQMELLLRQWAAEGRLVPLIDRPGQYFFPPGTEAMPQSDSSWRYERREIASIFSEMEEGREVSACEALLAHIDLLLERSRVSGALLCFELAIGILRRLAERFSRNSYCSDGSSGLGKDPFRASDVVPSAEPPHGRRFVTAVLKAADISMYLTKFHIDTRRLCEIARDVAHAVGAERDAMLLHLVESCLENMAAECLPDRMRELHALCENALSRLKTHRPPGDAAVGADIQASYFMGMFHFWHGRFQDVLMAFEEAQKHPQIWKGRFQTEMFPLYTSSSALYLGRHHQAVGILEAARRAAAYDQDRFKTMWWEAQLGVVLVYMGHLEDALELFDPVIARADPESETKVLHWGMRGLASYHYMRGHTRSSHTVMREAMRMARRNGLKRPIFSYPWMFDMLHAYEQAGLDPIEGLNLEEELHRAIDGYNLHLRAAALRTQAERRLLHGDERGPAVDLLRRSLNDFRLSGNPLEIERTKALLQRIRDDASRSSGRTCPERPGDAGGAALPHGSGPEDVMPVHPDDGETMASDAGPSSRAQPESQALDEWLAQMENNCRLALNSIRGIMDLSRYACQVAYIASCELGAERTALFRVDSDGTVHMEASCNMSRAEIETKTLASSLSAMEKALSVPLLLEDVEHVSLILPLDLGEERRWLLYLESRYSVRALSSIPTAMQASLMRIFAHSLRDIVRHQEKGARVMEDVGRGQAAQPSPHGEGSEVMLYSSPLTRRVLSHARQIAATDAPVLILGETGVGKELLAKYVHDCSGLTGNFVPVHPASIPEGLFESEFFGHERGAFTGAHKQKIGLAEMAHQGTLFIDEVGDIPAPMQVKLLRVFQDRRFMRVGGNAEIRSEFRLVGATNKDLWQEVRAGNFREDLYYRMAVVPLLLPPLRERPEDILMLARRFIDRFARRYHRDVGAVSDQALSGLLTYDWPGNVRELKSVIERAVILHQEGNLDFSLAGSRTRAVRTAPHGDFAALPPSYEDLSVAASGHVALASNIAADFPTVDVLLARYITRVLERTNGRITGPRGALGILGMKRSTLYTRMKQYGISGK